MPRRRAGRLGLSREDNMSKKEQKMAAIAAAKAPVQGWMTARAQLEAQLEAHDAAGAGVIKALVETAEANGPFRFEQGLFNFRQVKNGSTFSVHQHEEKAEL
jgi:hypothetical protein